jgi:hypothetical protein
MVLVGCGVSGESAGKKPPAPRSSAGVSSSKAPSGDALHSGSSPLTSGVDTDFASIPGHRVDQFDAFLRPILDRAEPENDDWQSEVIASDIAARLKDLAKLLGHPADITATSVEPFVADKVSVAKLRPPSRRKVFEDSSLTIFFEADDPASEPSVEIGSAAFARALAELLDPLRDCRSIDVHFKVFRIETRPDGQVTSLAYFDSRGERSNGIVQQNAVWHCTWNLTQSPPRLTAISASAYEEAIPQAGGGPIFEDVTQSVLGNTESFQQQLTRGVDYWRGRLEANYGVDPNGNQGLALGDVNGDGLDDLFVCQQGGLPNRLYIQNPDGTLRDVSSDAGVDWMEMCRSALLVDLDNDGDQDLAMAQGWYLMIMLNDGQGHFQKVMEERAQANLYSLAAADYDHDGDLDLFCCGRNPLRERNAPEGILGTPIPYHDANNGGPNMLWRNDGNGRFTDVTKDVGLDVNNRRYTYAASWEDFDNDGDMDLYVANDFGRNNLYQNDLIPKGSPYFTDVAAEQGVEDISAGMSITWGDYNNDGRMDAYVSNMFSSAGNRITYQRQFRPSADQSNVGHFRRHARGNTLFEQAASGFHDVSDEAAVTMGRWAWGATFCDLNNDGWEDLYVTNGFITTEDTGDL